MFALVLALVLALVFTQGLTKEWPGNRIAMNHICHNNLSQPLPQPVCGPQFQRGNVLLISLALLAAITLLGIAAMQSAIQGERLSSNFHERHIASESAQSALATGTTHIANYSALPLLSQASSGGYYYTLDGTSAAPALDLNAWTSALSYTVANWTAPPSAPLYKIEAFSQPNATLDIKHSALENQVNSVTYYRVYGRGTGVDPNLTYQTIMETVMFLQ